jgi:glycosyltransferase involved in cell wall biosynthesis
VQYAGPIGAAERSDALGAAHALLHLIDFDEPFGYSVVEAMACGTPVIAYDRGSMGELIDDGVTGFVVRDLAGATAAVERVGALDRDAIRAATVVRFDRATMVDRYVSVYEGVLAERAAPTRSR